MIIGKLTMLSSLFARSIPSACCPASIRSSGVSRQTLMVSAFVSDEAKGKASRAKAGKKSPTGDEIKRAPSAMNLYFKSAIPALKAAAPAGPSKGLLALGFEQWKALSPEAKAPFEAESNALKEAVAKRR
jgi:hypothetical protein